MIGETSLIWILLLLLKYQTVALQRSGENCRLTQVLGMRCALHCEMILGLKNSADGYPCAIEDTIMTSIEAFNTMRANITLKFALNFETGPECDETVHKVSVCLGEFTNKCKIIGPVSRFMQSTCAAQGPMESITFPAHSLKIPIEVSVRVQKVGEFDIQQLRDTEFRPLDDKEFTINSADLTLILRFYSSFSCLTDYYGDVCQVFCDRNAVEYSCDEHGNVLCRPGYFMDQLAGNCRLDQCATSTGLCQNGGTCLNNFDINKSQPICVCSSNFAGTYCERDTRVSLPQDISPHSKVIAAHPNFYTTSTNSSHLNNSKNKTNVIQHNHYFDMDLTTVRVDARNVDNRHAMKVTEKYSSPQELTPTYLSEVAFSSRRNRQYEDQKWRRTMILATIGIGLTLTLFLVFVGLILCFWRRRPQIQKPLNSTAVNNSHSNEHKINPVRRWATINQSPLRMLNSMEGDMTYSPYTTGLTTFGNVLDQQNLCQMETDQLDDAYNASERNAAAVYPFGPKTNIISGDETNVIGEKYPYTGNWFSTLPKNMCVPNKRLTWDVGNHETMKYNTLLQYTNQNTDTCNNQLTENLITDDQYRLNFPFTTNLTTNNKASSLHNSMHFMPYRTSCFDEQPQYPTALTTTLSSETDIIPTLMINTQNRNENNAFYTNGINALLDNQQLDMSGPLFGDYAGSLKTTLPLAPPPVEYADSRATFC